MNPYRAGVALGLLLFASVAIAGRGLGASGGFTVIGTAAAAVVAPQHVAAHPYLSRWTPDGTNGVFGDWAVLELVGIAMGAVVSARLSGRFRATVELTCDSEFSESPTLRLMRALLGGLLLGGGARLARGCTSGLGLTGGAMLSTGAWIFIPVAFACAFATAYAIRKWSFGRFSARAMATS